jgi:hypothetical protein
MNKLAAKSVEIAFALFDKKRLSFGPRCFVVCLAYYKNRLIVIETNSEKTDPNNLRNPLICRRTGTRIEKSKCCAEWNVIKRIKNTNNIPFGKISLVNVRIARNGLLGMSRPCFSCQSAFRAFEFKSLIYTLDSSRENPIFEEYES